MRIDRSKEEAFAALFKAGKKPRAAQRKPKPEPSSPLDEDGELPNVRQYKTRREREIEAIEYEDRRAKQAAAIRQRRLDRIASQFPAARRFFKTLEKAAPDVEVTAYLDCDVDLAGLARSLRLSAIEDDHDRFAVYEVAVAMVRKRARKTKYAAPDPETYFATGIVTALDELKQELRLT